ncbi:hypothetical protein AB0O75_48875 [Streptomyces sp. NPDC088921]|uniref:hypothetical protein n=1 Tax=unclassified Streptomyces TaxID=2593676 RepID=UPI0034300184
MSQMDFLEPESGIFVFDSIKVTGDGVAAKLADAFKETVEHGYHQAPGFLSARFYLSVAGDSLVTRVRWEQERDLQAYSAASAAQGNAFIEGLAQAEIVDRALFTGTRVRGFKGPAAEEEVGYTVVATRRVQDREGAHKVHEVLLETGEWKHTIPGFVSSSPYVSLDGTEFLNNPKWVDEDAFHVYMNHPSIPGGLASAQDHALAEPCVISCRIMSDIDA